MQTGKSRQTVTTYLSSAVMQSRWKNAGYLQSAAADLHQPHHLIMKRKRQPTAISREEIMIYLKVQSPNRQYTTYNYPEWLGLMLLNALSTQELLSTQFIIVLWSICCTYSFWGKKKIIWEISMEFATFEESTGSENTSSKKQRDWPQTRGEVRWDANFLQTGPYWKKNLSL